MTLLHHHGFVHRQVAALRDHLSELEARGGVQSQERHFAPGELAVIREALARSSENEPDPGRDPYFARNPFISLMQSAMHEHLVTTRGPEAVERDDEAMGEAFTKTDLAGWGVKVGLSLIWRFLHGSHPFTDAPATIDTGDHVRLVLVSDWGTGQQAARDVIDRAAEYVRGSELPVHLIHLGDTYYSGTPFEARRHVIDLWPVTADEAIDVGSWALNGNHDMYSGGHGYFETILGDARFGRQWVDGAPTSWFHLTVGDWDVIGLDTAFRDPIADIRGDDLFLFGRLGYLHGSQAEYVNRLSTDRDRRLLLLSHHQLFSAYDEDSTKENEMRTKLAPALEHEDVDAWFWGHEHDCLTYRPFRGVKAACVIGHGAIPTLVRSVPPPEDGAGQPPVLVRPTVAPQTPADHPIRAIDWEYRDSEVGQDGERWAKHGFAVLDVGPQGLDVAYVDEHGHPYATQRI